MTGGRGRKHKQLIDDLKEKGEFEKKEVIDRPLRRTGIRRVRRKAETTW